MLYYPNWNVLGHILFCMLIWDRRMYSNIKLSHFKVLLCARSMHFTGHRNLNHFSKTVRELGHTARSCYKIVPLYHRPIWHLHLCVSISFWIYVNYQHYIILCLSTFIQLKSWSWTTQCCAKSWWECMHGCLLFRIKNIIGTQIMWLPHSGLLNTPRKKSLQLFTDMVSYITCCQPFLKHWY